MKMNGQVAQLVERRYHNSQAIGQTPASTNSYRISSGYEFAESDVRSQELWLMIPNPRPPLADLRYQPLSANHEPTGAKLASLGLMLRH